jgi:hypothetical protein
MDSSFKDFVNNKKIAVIGPAPSAMSNNKDDIESYDIIMRFNSAVPVPVECQYHIGSRTDILCNCLEEHPVSGGHIDPVMWYDNGVKWILSPYPKLSFTEKNIERFQTLNTKNIPLEIFDKNKYIVLEKTLRTRPNSGLLGILHLLSFDVSKIYVTGFTFGRGGYYKGYKAGITAEQYNKLANGPYHTQKPQEDYFKHLYKTNKNIIVDDTLKGIISEYILY